MKGLRERQESKEPLCIVAAFISISTSHLYPLSAKLTPGLLLVCLQRVEQVFLYGRCFLCSIFHPSWGFQPQSNTGRLHKKAGFLTVLCQKQQNEQGRCYKPDWCCSLYLVLNRCTHASMKRILFGSMTHCWKQKFSTPCCLEKSFMLKSCSRCLLLLKQRLHQSGGLEHF